QGAIVVETRAGAFEPDARGVFDPSTAGGALQGGWSVGDGAFTAALDLTRTLLSPGLLDNYAYRFAGQLAHRAAAGAAPAGVEDGAARLRLDTRLDVYQVFQKAAEDPDVAPGVASSNRDRG